MIARRCFPSRGFSLIEVLAAMAVLVLLMVLVTQILSGANTTTSASRARLEADSEARMVLDRMGEDFARLVNRKDVDFVVRKNAGNDEFYFYSEAPAITPANATIANPTQPVALVGYRINPKYQLERLGKGLTWEGTPPDGAIFLTFPGPVVSPSPSPTPLPASTLTGSGSGFATLLAAGGTNDAYHILGQNVFRLEFTFLLKPDLTATPALPNAKYSNVPYANANHTRFSISSATGDITNDLGFGLSDVQAVVVTLVLMDSRSRMLLDVADPAAKLAALALKFPDPTQGNLQGSPATLPAKLWQGVIDAGSLGIPKATAAQLRVYQRVFFLKSGVN